MIKTIVKFDPLSRIFYETIDLETIAEKETIDNYTYYLYVRSNGEWVILRILNNSDNARYAFGSSNFLEAWTNKTNLQYGYGLIGKNKNG